MATQNESEISETFDLLRHPYRRYVLYHLTHLSDTVEFDTLVASLADWDADHPGESRRSGGGAVDLQLHHIHLPKLADAGVVSFDPDAGVVELVETDDRLLDAAARVDDSTRPVSSS